MRKPVPIPKIPPAGPPREAARMPTLIGVDGVAVPSQETDATKRLAIRTWARVEVVKAVAAVLQSRPFALVLVALIGALAGC